MSNDVIENLVAFGLTRQEAQIYLELLSHQKCTGYEISKITGISRSNVYASLNALVEKGAAYLQESDASYYLALSVKEFTENCLTELNKKSAYLIKNAPKASLTADGYITISGETNIRNKIIRMINETTMRLYILAPSSIIKEYESYIAQQIKDKKKVVVITDNYEIKGAKNYQTEVEPNQLRLITDSSYVLTGDVTNTCLYSGQENLVSLLKEALKNKIILLEK